MNDIYIPPNCLSLDKSPTLPQIRLLLQGPPGCGKTTESLTFPNPIVLNFNRGLGAHASRSDVIEVPFYNPTFVDKIHPRDGLATPPNRKDALHIWLHTEGHKLTANQTLVIDSSTEVESAYHTQYKLNPYISKLSGKIDERAEWRQKIEYFDEIMDEIKSLKCHVVYICHEADDSSVDAPGAKRPLMTGQVCDKLASHFTDAFRCHSYAKPIGPESYEKFKTHFNVSDIVATQWTSSTPKEHSSFYLWETTNSQIARHVKTSTLYNAPRFVVAHYNTFSQYKRPTTT